jgi:hypothetical protein
MAQITKAIGKKFQFTVENTNSGTDKIVALTPAYFDTTGNIEQTDGIQYIHNANPAWINAAGYSCDVVADDFKADGTGSGLKTGNAAIVYEGVKVTPVNATFNYRDFIRFIKENPLSLVGMTIKQLNTVDIFDRSIEVIKASPIQTVGQDSINLDQLKSVNQYDSTKVDVDLSDSPLMLSHETLLLMNVPGGAKIGFTFKF